MGRDRATQARPIAKNLGSLVLLAALVAACQRSPAPTSGSGKPSATPPSTAQAAQAATPPSAQKKDQAPLVAAEETEIAAPEGERGGSPQEDRVKKQLQQLIEWARAGDCARLADHVVYRGKDKARRWKATSRYDVTDERGAVDGICGRIAGYAKKGEPKYLGFKTERESEGQWLVLSVRFGPEGKKRHFAFLDISGRLAIGDID